MDTPTPWRMNAQSITRCDVAIPQALKRELFAHLFPGDGEEHGAVLAAGIAMYGGTLRLLVRHVFLAREGADYRPGRRSHRELQPRFIADRLGFCRDHRMAYLAVHNHGGQYSVGFSQTDLASHERGYPTLLDLAQGLPVGALVFAQHASAGDIWLDVNRRLPTTEVRVIGDTCERLTERPEPIPAAVALTRSMEEEGEHHRQILMLGAAGQARLRQLRVGVIGLGGVGSLIVQSLAHLGIGQLLLADPERVELSNLSRVVGARRWDARWPWSHPRMPMWVRTLAQRLSARKTSIARRMIRRISPATRVDVYHANIAQAKIASAFRDCDFLFLAADSAQSRLLFNALVHQYYVPGIQIGSKVVPGSDGSLQQAFSVIRRVWPGFGCLWCAGLIPAERLAWEAKSEREQREQHYGVTEPDPSVITLNSIGAGHAVNEFLFSTLNLRMSDADTAWWARSFDHVRGRILEDHARPDQSCSECGSSDASRLGRGDAEGLPVLGSNE